MNEIINGYLVELMESLKNGANFIIGELPAFAHEIVAWGIASSIISIVLSWVSVYAFWVIYTRAGKITANHQSCEYGEYPAWWAWIFGMIGFGISGLIASISTFCGVFSIFKAIFAPRLYLIESIAKMVSGN